MNLDFLKTHYKYELIPQPFAKQKVQTAYLAFILDKITDNNVDDIRKNYPNGPLQNLNKSKEISIVEFVHAIEKIGVNTYKIHVFRALFEPVYVATILKNFPLDTEVHRYIAKGRNEKYLLSRRLVVTFHTRQNLKDLKFFSSDPRLIEVIMKNDPYLYSKDDFAKAKEPFKAQREKNREEKKNKVK